MSDDESRRREIVRRTFLGLEEDLDDLRDELGRQFEDYETRLEKLTGALPGWLEIHPGTLRALFSFEFAGGAARLGPRAVAMAAAHVEKSILDLRDIDEKDTLDLKRNEVVSLMAELEASARECALDADGQLGELLDSILIELEDQREADESTLRDLVNSGDLEKGRQARKEIAELWEEQRVRAIELKAAWEPIEALVFEGVDLTVSGIDELRSLLNRTVEGLGGTPTDRVAAALADDVSRVTEQLQPDVATEEWERDSDVKLEGPSQPELPMWGVTDPADLGPTDKVDVRALASTDSPVGEVAPEPTAAEPESEPSKLTSVHDGPADSADSAESDELDEHVQEPLEDVLDTVESERIPLLATLPASESNELLRVPGDFSTEETRGHAMRVVEEWRAVSILERGVVLLPLLVFVITSGISAVPRLSGIEPAFDVYARLPWLFPWGFLGVSTLTFILLVVRHWRIRWAGGPELVQWNEHEQEVEVVVDRQGVRVGDVRYPRKQLSGYAYRWESKPDGTFGWAIRLEPRTSSALTMLAPERNYTRWDQSSLIIEEVDPSSWQTTQTVVDGLRSRLGI